MERPVLYSWTAVRSGAAITVTHSCGKVVNVSGIGVIDGKVLASKPDGSTFELHVPDGADPAAHALQQMGKPTA